MIKTKISFKKYLLIIYFLLKIFLFDNKILSSLKVNEYQTLQL